MADDDIKLQRLYSAGQSKRRMVSRTGRATSTGSVSGAIGRTGSTSGHGEMSSGTITPRKRARSSIASRAGAKISTVALSGVRTLVSKRKRRFQMDGYNLDLSYITNNIIAMGFPSDGASGLYRNPVAEVVRFLDERHPDSALIINLCSERAYQPSVFAGRAIRLPFHDHNPPSQALLHRCMFAMDTWLAGGPHRVVAVHCKAGKGRTGCVIAAYLAHAGFCASPERGLQWFGRARTYNAHGVTIASQMRAVYMSTWPQRSPDPPTVELHALSLPLAPRLDGAAGTSTCLGAAVYLEEVLVYDSVQAAISRAAELDAAARAALRQLSTHISALRMAIVMHRLSPADLAAAPGTNPYDWVGRSAQRTATAASLMTVVDARCGVPRQADSMAIALANAGDEQAVLQALTNHVPAWPWPVQAAAAAAGSARHIALHTAVQQAEQAFAKYTAITQQYAALLHSPAPLLHGAGCAGAVQLGLPGAVICGNARIRMYKVSKPALQAAMQDAGSGSDGKSLSSAVKVVVPKLDVGKLGHFWVHTGWLARDEHAAAGMLSIPRHAIDVVQKDKSGTFAKGYSVKLSWRRTHKPCCEPLPSPGGAQPSKLVASLHAVRSIASALLVSARGVLASTGQARAIAATPAPTWGRVAGASTAVPVLATCQVEPARGCTRVAWGCAYDEIVLEDSLKQHQARSAAQARAAADSFIQHAVSICPPVEPSSLCGGPALLCGNSMCAPPAPSSAATCVSSSWFLAATSDVLAVAELQHEELEAKTTAHSTSVWEAKQAQGDGEQGSAEHVDDPASIRAVLLAHAAQWQLDTAGVSRKHSSQHLRRMSLLAPRATGRSPMQAGNSPPHDTVRPGSALAASAAQAEALAASPSAPGRPTLDADSPASPSGDSWLGEEVALLWEDQAAEWQPTTVSPTGAGMAVAAAHAKPGDCNSVSSRDSDDGFLNQPNVLTTMYHQRSPVRRAWGSVTSMAVPATTAAQPRSRASSSTSRSRRASFNPLAALGMRPNRTASDARPSSSSAASASTEADGVPAGVTRVANPVHSSATQPRAESPGAEHSVAAMRGFGPSTSVRRLIADGASGHRRVKRNTLAVAASSRAQSAGSPNLRSVSMGKVGAASPAPSPTASLPEASIAESAGPSPGRGEANLEHDDFTRFSSSHSSDDEAGERSSGAPAPVEAVPTKAAPETAAAEPAPTPTGEAKAAPAEATGPGDAAAPALAAEVEPPAKPARAPPPPAKHAAALPGTLPAKPLAPAVAPAAVPAAPPPAPASAPATAPAKPPTPKPVPPPTPASN